MLIPLLFKLQFHPQYSLFKIMREKMYIYAYKQTRKVIDHRMVFDIYDFLCPLSIPLTSPNQDFPQFKMADCLNLYFSRSNL